MEANQTISSVQLESAAVSASESEFAVRDGTRLHSYRWTSRAAEGRSGAVILLVHGYGEYGRRYDHFARYLAGRGYVVHSYDQRGHGFSPGQRGHIQSYAQYVDDCSDVARQVAELHPQRALVLIGHSNGGLQVLRTVQRGEVAVAGLVMVCPMVALQPSHRPISRGVASVLAALMPRLPLPNGIDVRQLSHDSAINEAWKADPMNHGRTTLRWYLSGLDAMAQAHAEAAKVTLPVLTLAAEFDTIVDPRGVVQLAEQLASADREIVTVEGAFHEVLNELDRAQTYARIGGWLNARFARASAVHASVA